MAWDVVDRLKEPALSGEAVLDDTMKAEIESDFGKYPTKRAVLLQALHLVQNKYRHVNDQAIVEIAALLELSPAEVLDTLSFYDMYSRKEQGEHKIGVCVSLSCELCGCKEIFETLKAKLGIGPGQTSDDGKFTVMPMECIGTCEYAPAILMDETLCKIESAAQLEELIEKV